MIRSDSLQRIIVIGLIVVLKAGCSSATTPIPPPTLPPSPVPPTDINTPIPPPTLPPSPVPPTDTNTPKPSTPAPTPVLAESIEDILGDWFSDGEHAMYLRFNVDGTHFVATSQEKLDSEPNVECTCSFEGAQMTLDCFEFTGIPPCPADAIYEVELLPNGNITFIRVKDSCAPRIRTMTLEYYSVP